MLGAPAKPVFPAPFEALRPLVQRGQREVWLTRDTRLDRMAVAKRLPVRDDATGGDALVATLRHPVLVDIYGVVTVQGQDWLISEFIDGRTLDGGDQLWSASAVLHTLADISLGLQALAAVGLVHGDLSPGNVMVDVSGQLRLIDFTQTLVEGESASGAGTPGFAAPEVVHGGPVTTLTDVWSLAALGIWMMSGHSPAWIGDDEGRSTLVVPAWRPAEPAGALLRDWLVSALRAERSARPDARVMAAEAQRLIRLFALQDRSDLRTFALAEVDERSDTGERVGGQTEPGVNREDS